MSKNPQKQPLLNTSKMAVNGTREGADHDTSPVSPRDAILDEESTADQATDETDQARQEATRIERKHRVDYPPPTIPPRTFEGLLYKLEAIQEPMRARMCGYGDKDRRPISSPPIFRLSIFHAATNQEVDYDSPRIVNSHFAAIVRIYNLLGTEDASVVTNSTSNGPVSATTITPCLPTPASRSYPRISAAQRETMAASAMPARPNGYHSNQSTMALPGPDSFILPGTAARSILNGSHDHYMPPTQYATQPSPYASGHAPISPPGSMSSDRSGIYVQGQYPPQPLTPPSDQSSQNITQNLIGCTATSGMKLIDLEGRPGIFFIFNDVSVRIESWFRLKCEVFDLVAYPDSLDHYTDSDLEEYARLNRTTVEVARARKGSKHQSIASLAEDYTRVRSYCPALAAVFTNCFRVYSAKKFPGVTDSTDISKLFARQGVKISVRKDGERNQAGKSSQSKRKRSAGADSEGLATE